MKKKMLFICPRPIFPVLWGERIRYYNNLSILAKKYRVDLLIIYSNENERLSSATNANLFGNQFFFKQSKLRSVFQALIALFRKEPLQIAYFYNPCAAAWIQKNYYNYDAIFCNNIRSAKYAIKLDCYKVLDYVDAISMNYQRAQDIAKGLKKILYKIEYKRLLIYERTLMDIFSTKMIISEKDRCHILKGYMGQNDILVIPNYVDNLQKDDENNIVKYRIGFVGKMNYEPNITAVEYFAKDVFPSIKKKFPTSTFYIIGGHPNERVFSLKKVCQGIYVTGFVDDVYSEMAKCDIIVAPMLTGAGLQNKIIQAMMFGKCVITTSIGKAGLPELAGDELCVVKGTKEYIEMITKLLNDSAGKKDIQDKARKYAIKYFSFDEVSNILLNVI